MCVWCVIKSCLTLWDPMDCSLSGYSVHGILQAGTLEWVAVSSSRGSSPPRDWTCVSCIGRQIIYHWATCEAPEICSLNLKFFVDNLSLCSLSPSPNSSSLNMDTLFVFWLPLFLTKNQLFLFFFFLLYMTCHLPLGASKVLLLLWLIFSSMTVMWIDLVSFVLILLKVTKLVGSVHWCFSPNLWKIWSQLL